MRGMKIAAAAAALMLVAAAPAGNPWTRAWTASMWQVPAEQAKTLENVTIRSAVRAGGRDTAELSGRCDERRDLGPGDDAAAIGRGREPRDIDRERVALFHPSGRRIGDKIEALGIPGAGPHRRLAEGVEPADQGVAALS